MKLSMIYIAMLAKKAELLILKDGFKNVITTANKLSKGAPRTRKGAFFAAVYRALKNLKMDWKPQNGFDNKYVQIVEHVRISTISNGRVITEYTIEHGAQFIPEPRRYKVFKYSLDELNLLMERYHFNLLFVG